MVSASAKLKGYKPRGRYPLAVVECTGCGLRFPSGAKSHTRCPQCGRNLRVHRSARRRAPIVQATAESRAEPVTVRSEHAFRQLPAVALPVPSLPLTWHPAAGDDDDRTYIKVAGYLVPAEWEQGRLVADLTAGLAAREWELRPHGEALCQVIRLKPHGYEWGASPDACIGRARQRVVGGVICDACYDALVRPLGN